MKNIALFLAIILCVSVLASCKAEEPAETTAAEFDSNDTIDATFDLYTCEKAIEYFRGMELHENEYYEISFTSSEEFEKFKELHGNEFVNEKGIYYINVQGEKGIATVSFSIKREPPQNVINGMYNVAFVTPSEISTLEWKSVSAEKRFEISLDVSASWSAVAEDENRTFLRYDKETALYLRALVFNATFKVDPSYALNGSIYGTVTPGGDTDLKYEKLAKTGKTKNGYEYVIYEVQEEEECFADIYIRIDDEYIIYARYWDKNANRELIEKTVDSICVKEYK